MSKKLSKFSIWELFWVEFGDHPFGLVYFRFTPENVIIRLIIGDL